MKGKGGFKERSAPGKLVNSTLYHVTQLPKKQIATAGPFNIPHPGA
jgi:hypothetical protein